MKRPENSTTLHGAITQKTFIFKVATFLLHFYDVCPSAGLQWPSSFIKEIPSPSEEMTAFLLWRINTAAIRAEWMTDIRPSFVRLFPEDARVPPPALSTPQIALPESKSASNLTKADKSLKGVEQALIRAQSITISISYVKYFIVLRAKLSLPSETELSSPSITNKDKN